VSDVTTSASVVFKVTRLLYLRQT